jgi:hypothetical protein
MSIFQCSFAQVPDSGMYEPKIPYNIAVMDVWIIAAGERA